MLPILNIGPLALQFPGLLLLLGVWLATLTIDREATRRGISPDSLNKLVFIGLIVGVVGARFGYVLRYLDVYLREPLGIFSLNTSTLALSEGLLAGALGALIYAQRKDLPFWSTLDALTPGLALFSIFVGFSHLSSGDAFGAPTSAPWAVELWGAWRHPSQVYEILAALLVFFIVSRLKHDLPFAGFLVLSFVVLAATSRMFLEAFRGDSVIIFGAVRSVQLRALILVLGSLLGMHQLAVRRRVEDSTG